MNLSGPYFKSLCKRSRGQITPSTQFSSAPDLSESFTLGAELANADKDETFFLTQQSHATLDEFLTSLKHF